MLTHKTITAICINPSCKKKFTKFKQHYKNNSGIIARKSTDKTCSPKCSRDWKNLPYKLRKQLNSKPKAKIDLRKFNGDTNATNKYN